MSDRALLWRTATIAVGAPLVVAAVWYGGLPLLLMVNVLTVLGLAEYAKLVDAAGYQASFIMMAAGGLAFPLLAAARLWGQVSTIVVTLVIAVALASLAPQRRAGALGHAGVELLGMLYVGALFAYLVITRDAFGPAATLTILGIIWANDVVAYSVGSVWGRRKLAPAISPGKSVEGFAGGLVGALVIALAVGRMLGWPLAPIALLGFCVALGSVVGDLWESTMKRTAGVKDTGGLLPGHGGVLDRFDAVLFGVPIGYYVWRWLM